MSYNRTTAVNDRLGITEVASAVINRAVSIFGDHAVSMDGAAGLIDLSRLEEVSFGNLDSLDFVELLAQIEDDLDINVVDDEDADRLVSIIDLAETVRTRAPRDELESWCRRWSGVIS